MEALSAYELERLENMKRNSALLRSLGVEKAIDQSSVPHTRRKTQPARGPQRTASTNGSASTFIRRSTRLQNMEPVDYSALDDLAPKRHTRLPQGRPPSPPVKKPKRDTAYVADLPQRIPRNGKNAHSSRELLFDVDRMMNDHLGQPMASTGKAAAMDTACADQLCSVKFNKYSGVAEWQNACTLWVNVDGGDYVNEFFEKDGLIHMTWFAGSRHEPDTPVIQRLLDPTTTVALFCRFPGEPYIFLGRLRHVNSDFTMRPLRFLWKLLDSSKLSDSEHFRSIVMWNKKEKR